MCPDMIDAALYDLNKRVLDTIDKVDELKQERANTPLWNFPKQYKLWKEWRNIGKYTDMLGEELNALERGMVP